ncbi:uncharacterized protein LOC6599502 [Drosophila persimilis]|uniref:Uncharacterized protein n=4 Tax=Drosophila pseudoobscura TaxID=7237 RepID=A0A6I8UEM6_DROPS|nr:uncharacterized protein LOC4814107 [Drosophila pseudoobscura]XP_026849551.1 uncharacterized protein LOC6599502 [Drosophila persimilis]
MASMGNGFAKCFILFMAIVILLQGVVYLGLSIWGVTFRECHDVEEFGSNPFKFAMELIYFSEKECGSPEIMMNGQKATLEMDWEKSYAVTHREYIFMITYAVVSGLWIATSLLIIFTLCSRTTKLIAGAAYWPWFLSVMAGSILDVVASVYHGIDLSHTTSLRDALDYIGAYVDPDSQQTVLDQIYLLLEPFGVYFSTPSILLLCLSCRVVLIWLLNIIGASFCLSISGIMAQNNSKAAAVTRSQAPTRQPTPLPVPEAVVEATVVETLQPETQPQYLVETQYPEQIRPKPLPIFIPSEQMQRQDSQQYRAGDRTTLQSPVMVLPPQQQQEPTAPQQTPQREVLSPLPDINTYRTTEAHPDRLNYPPVESPLARAPSPAVQQLAVNSALNNRYSEMYPTPPANPRVSEELRNQMPWSYTSMVTKPPPPPRKPQLQVQIYPQIPEPDYAEH